MTTDEMIQKLRLYADDCDRHAVNLAAKEKQDLAEIKYQQCLLASDLMARLDDLQREFEEKEESDRPQPDWNLPEKLERLNITAPPDWNEYDSYLLNGGNMEYEEWKQQGGDCSNG